MAEEEGRTPLLTLDGFSGPLGAPAHPGARAAGRSGAPFAPGDLVDQLDAALQQATPAMLGQKGDWVVMAAWLVLLRSRLLLPADARRSSRRQTAEADQLRDRLIGLQDDAGARRLAGAPAATRPATCSRAASRSCSAPRSRPPIEVDVVEFLWASLALFDDEPAPDTADVYRPRWFDLYTVAEARERILRLLAETPEGVLLARLLPDSLYRIPWQPSVANSAEIAPALRLGQQPHCQPGVGEAGKGRAGAGRGFPAHPRRPDIGAWVALSR